jgi:cytochrome oxidase Cu insertion factor (SCO1/SenC/PrrC family)
MTSCKPGEAGMRTLRVIRYVAFAGIALLLAAIAVFEFVPGVRDFIPPHSGGSVSSSAEDTVSVPAGVPIGGPFELTDEKGRSVRAADYRGRWMLVFFGYTNCPDECPLTLQKMAATLKDLGPLADRIAPLFITVDPARDTPQQLASYLENFDTRIIGLTGSNEQIATAAKAYRVYYNASQNEQSGADLVSHSTFLYLMDPNGKLNALFSQDVTPEKLTAALRTRLSSKQSQRVTSTEEAGR